MDENRAIKSMVFSGGGQTFFTFYGILKQSSLKDFWKYENIETVYGTSAGAMLSIFFALNIEWDILDNYIIKRPWDKIFDLSLHSLSNIVEHNGIFNKSTIIEIFKPLLSLKDMDENVTLKEFYEITKKDIHIFTSEVNSFKSIDLNHETYPNWKLVDAVYASCCVPLIFEPIMDGSCCYIDGGMLQDFPINEALKKYEEHEIFAIKKYGKEIQNISSDTNLIDFVNIMFVKSLKQILNSEKKMVPNTIFLQDNQVSLEEILSITSSMELRIQSIEKGIIIFDEFLRNKENV